MCIPIIQKLTRFFHNRSAAATAVTAGMVTIMSLGGIALAGDHIYLVYQRDLLKAAADSASMAATRRLASLGHGITQAELERIARRYVLANIPADKRPRAAATLSLTVAANRAAGTVNVDAQADLGGLVFGRLLGMDEGDNEMRTASKVEASFSLTEVVLAIDSTPSMLETLDGQTATDPADARLAIVKQAAQDLVDILNDGGAGQVAIGLVPWHYQVRLNQTTRQDWESNSWAQYPTSRYYPIPYAYAPNGVTYSSLPAQPEAWAGCPDQRGPADLDALDISMGPPSTDPFTMGFYTYMIATPKLASIRFRCRTGSLLSDYCYSEPSLHAHQGYQFGQPPQRNCANFSEITPLTTDADSIKAAIRNLYTPTRRTSTYSALGVVWGQRLLTHEWRDAWGGNPVHPADPTQYPDMRKVLVLLTDGEDTQHMTTGDDGTAISSAHLDNACTEAKDAGIKVFVIAAMSNPGGQLQDNLENCSSKHDDPDKQYVFVNNITPEALEEAFRDIAWQLLEFRRAA